MAGVKAGYAVITKSVNELDNLIEDGSIILPDSVEGEDIDVDDNHKSALSGIILLVMIKFSYRNARNG